MNNTIIFLSLLIIVLSIMLVFKININFDLQENFLKIKIQLFNITIITIRISIIGLYYQINNSKKLKTLNILIDKKQEYLIIQIKKSVIDKLYYDDIVVKSEFGIGAKNTAIIVGLTNIFLSHLANKFILEKKDTRLYFETYANFLNPSCKFDITFKVYFTIFDLVFAILISFYKRGKYVRKEKRQFR